MRNLSFGLGGTTFAGAAVFPYATGGYYVAGGGLVGFL